jgi:hypothetical protein
MEFFDRANWTSRASRVTPLLSATAAERHREREPYGVRLEDGVIIEFYFGNTHCDVHFNNESGVSTLEYSFEERDGRLFLFEARVIERDHGSGRRIDAERYIFSPSGTVRRIKGREVETRSFGLDANWEKVPMFGDYRSLARREREPLQW